MSAGDPRFCCQFCTRTDPHTHEGEPFAVKPGVPEGCRCGSGLHPRRCEVHPERYQEHCDEISRESQPGVPEGGARWLGHAFRNDLNEEDYCRVYVNGQGWSTFDPECCGKSRAEHAPAPAPAPSPSQPPAADDGVAALLRCEQEDETGRCPRVASIRSHGLNVCGECYDVHRGDGRLPCPRCPDLNVAPPPEGVDGSMAGGRRLRRSEELRKQGREQERAAVVRYLRWHAKEEPTHELAVNCIADLIAAGDHLTDIPGKGEETSNDDR
jgi:hypothetical protein